MLPVEKVLQAHVASWNENFAVFIRLSSDFFPGVVSLSGSWECSLFSKIMYSYIKEVLRKTYFIDMLESVRPPSSILVAHLTSMWWKKKIQINKKKSKTKKRTNAAHICFFDGSDCTIALVFGSRTVLSPEQLRLKEHFLKVKPQVKSANGAWGSGVRCCMAPLGE